MAWREREKMNEKHFSPYGKFSPPDCKPIRSKRIVITWVARLTGPIIDAFAR